ncbi:MAG TPA: SgcJ/EcaC family oxidoreductase [Gemmataceae bacterium]|nr:SgcJ/EcaC family oxidoreductase [Gemmataceae bacterium]
MRTRLLWFLSVPALLLCLTAMKALDEPRKGNAEAEASIQKNGEAFVEAFHKGDAKALAAFWTPDGEYTDQAGTNFKGREAIEKLFQEFFAQNKGMKVQIDSQKLHFVSPDVAIEEGTTEIFGPDGGPPSRARFSNTHVKLNDKWLLGSVRESAFTPPSNYEHLRGLEWAIGEWAGQAEKGEVEHFALAWSDNHNFIVGHASTSFKTALIGSAQQWIRWDPLAKRLQSYIFDDSGAFGEGAWTNEGDKWTLKAALVLQDGKKATATYTFAPADADTIAFQSLDRSVDGKPLPESKEIKLKRVH